MNGIVFDIKRFAVHDGPGIRTTIFLKGCPLKCWWCHNPESQELESESEIKQILLDGVKYEKKAEIGQLMSALEVMETVDKDALFYDESGGGVTLSGGEPLMQSAFAIEILKISKSRGYHTAVDTCGYVKPEILEKAAAFTNLFLYDLKHPNGDEHRKYTGVDNVLIINNLNLLTAMEKQVIIRIPVITGINNFQETIKQFIEIIEKAKRIHEVHLLPFHALADSKYNRLKKENKLAGLNNLEKQDLFPIKQQFEESGFNVKIGG